MLLLPFFIWVKRRKYIFIIPVDTNISTMVNCVQDTENYGKNGIYRQKTDSTDSAITLIYSFYRYHIEKL